MFCRQGARAVCQPPRALSERARGALAAQGIDAAPPSNLSEAQVRSLAGNAMCVDVLCHLFAKVLATLGIEATVPPPLAPLRHL